MDDVTSIKAQRFKETENKRYNMQMRKLRADHDRSYKKEVKKNKSHMERLKMEYEGKVGTLETELEKKLIQQRDKHARVLEIENKRLGQELLTLKAAHKGKVAELRDSQEREMNDLLEYQKKNIEKARQRYQKEKTKWEES